jgi:hypothetical protein
MEALSRRAWVAIALVSIVLGIAAIAVLAFIELGLSLDTLRVIGLGSAVAIVTVPAFMWLLFHQYWGEQPSEEHPQTHEDRDL